MPRSERDKPNVILIPSHPRACPPSSSGDTMPDITFSPTSAFHLDFFASNSPVLNPPSSSSSLSVHPYATLPRRAGSFQSSGSESSGPRQQQSPNLARTASDGSHKFGPSASKRTPSTSSTLDGSRPRDLKVSNEFARPPPAARSASQGSVGSMTANGRLLARDPKSNKAIKEDEEDEDSEPDEFTPKKKTVRKESLAELVRPPFFFAWLPAPTLTSSGSCFPACS